MWSELLSFAHDFVHNHDRSGIVALIELAEELLRLKVEVIVAVNTPAVQAAKKASQIVPVVMMRVADPVKSGLVASLARPGGNVTGLSFMPDALGPKGVELLHEILPKITRIAALPEAGHFVLLHCAARC